jgi:hypothetical protein
MPPCHADGCDVESRRLHYVAGNAFVTVEILYSALFEPARYLFPHYEVLPPGRDLSFPPDVSVWKDPKGYVVATRDAPSVSCGTETEALAALEFALTRAIVESFSDYVHLHASGAVVRGRAVLALGKSGAGKSSMAASWLSQGFPTLGDDIVFLNAAAKAVPFKRLFKVTPVVLQTLGVDPATTLQWDPEWPEAWYAPDDGPGWAEEAPVSVVAFVRYDPSVSLTTTPMSAEDGLNALVHSMMDTGKRAGDCFDTLVRVVEGARVVRVEYSSAFEAAEALCSLMK